jgi:hypothetical protein
MANRPIKFFKMASGLLVAGTAGCLATAQNFPGQPLALTPAEGPKPQLLQVQPAPVKLVRLGEPAATGSAGSSRYVTTRGTDGIQVLHLERPPVTLVRAASETQAPADAELLPAPKSAPAEPVPAAGPPTPQAAAQGTPPGPTPQRCAPPLSQWARCKRALQECFLGFREEFLSPPLGHYLYEHGKTMVANGDAARMVLYQYDFEEGCDRLNLRGHDQLVRISAMLPQNFFPIVVERTPCQPGLAEARRLMVLNELAHGAFPVPPERVVIGPALATGVSGREAEIIYLNLLGQTAGDGLPFLPRTQSSSVLGSTTGTGSGAIGVGPGPLTPR